MPKYHNVPLDSEGRSRQVCGYLNIDFKKAFDSTGEYGRYVELTRLQDAGEISGLSCQVPFALFVTNTKTGVRVKIADYIADFCYVRDGKEITEDFKGVRTETYRLKKKFLKAQDDIVILESRAKERKKRVPAARRNTKA